MARCFFRRRRSEQFRENYCESTCPHHNSSMNSLLRGPAFLFSFKHITSSSTGRITSQPKISYKWDEQGRKYCYHKEEINTCLGASQLIVYNIVLARRESRKPYAGSSEAGRLGVCAACTLHKTQSSQTTLAEDIVAPFPASLRFSACTTLFLTDPLSASEESALV